MFVYLACGRLAYASIFCLRAGTLLRILDQVSGRIAYALMFGLRAIRLYFNILPAGE